MIERLPALVRIVVIACGAIHAIAAAAYQSMNPDGISYLDIADAYMRGDRATAVNAVWSPLYSWILGPVLALVRPSLDWEFPLVQAVNFVIFLGALAAFEFLWRTSRRDSAAPLLSEAAWRLIGYALFGWCALVLITVSMVTPDMLTAALVFAAAGLLVTIRTQPTARRFAALGAVLGAAYLAKSVMFPLGVLAIALASLRAHGLRRRLGMGLLALAAFLAVAGPFVLAVSNAKGRLTFGDAGPLTYAWLVNGVPRPHPHRGTRAPEGLVHPSRLVLDNPRTFEFGEPMRATYPMTFDPSYWYEGMDSGFSPAAQGRAVSANLAGYWHFFFPHLIPLAVLVFVGWLGGGRSLPAREWSRWSLTLLGTAGLAVYALVLVEGRYVAAFIPLVWGDLLANLRAPESSSGRRAVSTLALAAVVLLLAPVAAGAAGSGRALSLYWRSSPAERSNWVPVWPNQVAAELHVLGVPPGSAVAVIGYGPSAYWARLARVRIVAEILGWEANSFWQDASVRSRALDALAGTGAIAVVAESAPVEALPGWTRVGRSYHYIRLLSNPEG